MAECEQLDLFGTFDVESPDDLSPVYNIEGGYDETGDFEGRNRSLGGRPDAEAGLGGGRHRSADGPGGYGGDVEAGKEAAAVGSSGVSPAPVSSAGVREIDESGQTGRSAGLPGGSVLGGVPRDDGFSDDVPERDRGAVAAEVDIRGAGAGDGERVAEDLRKHDYHLGNSGVGGGSLGNGFRSVSKYEANAAAITLLKKLEAEDKLATQEEQRVLMGYVGWGGLPEVFRPSDDTAAQSRYERLRNLLTEEEYISARGSVLNAHYTEPTVARAVWKAVGRMGFGGGPVLDPSMGSGIFYATRPKDMDIKMDGVELDSITARISKKLYPGMRVEEGGFEATSVIRNSYNLAISNVPFGDYKLRDQSGYMSRLGLPDMVKNGDCLIHDFFFLKSMAGIRAGGLVAFVTSHGTLDKRDPSVREELARRCDFVGAIRLPNNTFRQIANTEVVTDIVFMQRRDHGVPMSSMTRDEFIPVAEKYIEVGDADDQNYGGTVFMSSYFVNHPEMVLGQERLGRGLYGDNEYTVDFVNNSRSLEQLLDAAVSRLPKNIVKIDIDRDELDEAEARKQAVLEEKYGALGIGSYILDKDGKLHRRVEGAEIIKLAELPEIRIRGNKKKGLDSRTYTPGAIKAGIGLMLQMRDTCREMYKSHRDGDTEKRTVLLERLNGLYDGFRERFGALNDVGRRFFVGDPSLHYVLGLEVAKEIELPDGEVEVKYEKSDVFSGKMFEVKQYADKVNTPYEALVLSLVKHGKIDLPYMSKLLGNGSTDKDLADKLVSDGYIFRDPERLRAVADGTGRQSDVYVVADEYLSGNVRKKLAEAERFAGDFEVAEGSGYKDILGNIARLNETVPKYLSASEIRIQMNSPLVKTEYVEQFLSEHVWPRERVGVMHSDVTERWEITEYPSRMPSKYDAVGASVFNSGDSLRLSAKKVVENILNGSAMTYMETRKTGDNTERKFNEEVSLDMQTKAERLNEAWARWVWGDVEQIQECMNVIDDPDTPDWAKDGMREKLEVMTNRREDLEKRYNDVFNSVVPRKYIHPERDLYMREEARLSGIADNAGASEEERGQAAEDLRKLRERGVRMDGCAFPSPLRPHQADAVYRVLQSDSTLLAHSVGSGKSLSMICAAMELRRLGLRDRILAVVPNPLMTQFAGQVKLAYPEANILIADEDSWGKDAVQQRQFVAQAVNNDYDMVIFRRSVFERIPCSKSYVESFMRDKINILRDKINQIENASYKRGFNASATKKDDASVKQIERQIKRLETQLGKMVDSLDKAQGAGFKNAMCFDDFFAGREGRVQLFVDEAHAYKNDGASGGNSKIKGLGSAESSNRALDMAMKIGMTRRYGGGVTFATGTPVSNSIVETYTMMNLLQPDDLDKMGVRVFDAWLRQFVKVEQSIEQNNTASGYKITSRASSILNPRALFSALRETWSVVTPEMLEESGIIATKTLDNDGNVISGDLPIVNDKTLLVKPTPILESYLGYLVAREEHLKKNKGAPQKGMDNVLTIIGDGRKMAVDPRLINENLSVGDNTKIGLVAKYLAEEYFKPEAMEKRLTSLVFWDQPCATKEVLTEKSKWDEETGEYTNMKKEVIFDGLAELRSRLAGLGVPPEAICLIRDEKTEDRQTRFDELNRGKIRIMVGNTPVMGEGVNAQKRMNNIIHMDLPWKPAELTQRNGRGIRSGNENNFINIVHAIAQDTVETGLLERLKAKQHFISEIMTMDLNNMGDEISDGEDRYNSLMELSTNNPLLRDSVMLKDDVRKLEIQAKTHRENGVRVMDRMRNLPDDIKKAQTVLDRLTSDVSLRPAEETLSGDNFHIKLLGKEFAIKKDADGKVVAGTESARKEAGTLIKDALKKFSMSRESNSIELGTYGNARISLESVAASGGSYYRSYYFKSVGSNGLGHEVHSDPLALDTDEVGLCRRIHNMVYDRTDTTLNVFKKRVQEYQKELDFCKSFSGGFSKETELQEKRVKLGEVLKLLGGDVGKKFNGAEYEFPWDGLRDMTREEIQAAEQRFYARFEYFKEHGRFEDDLGDSIEKEMNGVEAKDVFVLDNKKVGQILETSAEKRDVDADSIDVDDSDNIEVNVDNPLSDMELAVLVELEGKGTCTVLRYASIDKTVEMLESLADRGYLAFAEETDSAELTLKGRGAVYGRLSDIVYERAVVDDAMVSLVCKDAGLNRHIVKPVICDCEKEFKKYRDFERKFGLAGHEGEVKDIRSEHKGFSFPGYMAEAERIGDLYNEVKGYALELAGKHNTAVAKKFETACDVLDEYVTEECQNHQTVRVWSDRLDYDKGMMRGILYERFVSSQEAVRNAGEAIQAIEGVYNVRLSESCKSAMSKAVESGVPPIRVYDGAANHLERSPRYDWNMNCTGEYAMEYRRMHGGTRVADKDNINLIGRGCGTNEINMDLGDLEVNDYGVKILNSGDGSGKGNPIYGVYRCDGEDKMTGVVKLSVPEAEVKARVEVYALNRELELGMKELTLSYSNEAAKPSQRVSNNNDISFN